MTETDTIRTYETFEVRWTDDEGYTSTWSGYDTREAAETTVAYGAERGSGRHGEVIRKTFEARIPAASRHLYKGAYIAERAA